MCQHLVTDHHFDVEQLVVVGANLAGHPVRRQRPSQPLEPFLQARLVVTAEILGLPRILDLAGQLAHQELPGGLEAAVQVDRRDHRLAGVGQQRLLAAAAGLLLAAPEDHVIAKAHQLGHLRE